MTQWTQDHPGRGSMDALEAGVVGLRDSADAYEEARQRAEQALESAGEGVWTGSASGSWRETVSATRTELQCVVDTLGGASGAVDRYVGEVDAIAAQAAVDRDTIDLADRTIDELAWRVHPPWEIDAWQDDARQRALANSSRDDALRSLAQLAQRREEADDALVAALDTALPAGWERVQAAFASVGVVRPSQLTGRTAAAALQELAQDLLDDPDNPTPEEVAAFEELFDAYADDPEAMSEFFSELGGDDTVRLLETLGLSYDGGNEQALAVAQRLRHGLSVGSADWDADEATAFAQEMFYGEAGDLTPAQQYEIYHGGDRESWWFRYPAIAYLFADQEGALLGEQLTVAAAEILDEQLREYGGHMPSDANLPMSGALALSQAERFPDGMQAGGQYEDFGPGRDIAGEVLASLGGHPDAALEFLDPTGDESLGADRTDYWFQERDWSGLDGFEGPAALLLGVTQAEGGPYSVPRDDAASERIAQLASEAFMALTVNSGFESEHLSAEASARLVGALAPYVEGLTEYMTTHGFVVDEQLEPGVDFPELLDGTRGSPTPILGHEMIAELFGVIGAERTGTGAVALQQTADAVMAGYLLAAESDPTLLSEAVRRLTMLHGTVDGAELAEHLAAAERHDAVVDVQLDMLTGVLGALPVPHLGDAIGAGTMLGEQMLANPGSGPVAEVLAAWSDLIYQAPSVEAGAGGVEVLDQAQYVYRISSLFEVVHGDDPAVAAIIADRPEPPSGGMTLEYASELSIWWEDSAADGLEDILGMDGLTNLTSDYAQDHRAGQQEGGS